MATARKITDFMSTGTLAARPATPTLGTGEIAVYYATDTLHMFVYVTGTGWVQIDSAGAPAVVQFAQVTTRDSITLPAPPTQGNLLLGFLSDGTSTSIGAGWSLLRQTAQANDNTIIVFKIAGSGESATQSPNAHTGAGGTGGIVEVSLGGIIDGNDAEVTAANTQTLAVNAKDGGLIIGAVMAVATTNLPTGLTGAVQLQAGSAANSRSITLFKVAAPALGSNSVIATYAGSTRSNMLLVAIR